MTLEDKVHGLRLQVIRRAEALGNVSRACREAGISRALFYRWQHRVERYGLVQHERPTDSSRLRPGVLPFCHPVTASGSRRAQGPRS